MNVMSTKDWSQNGSKFLIHGGTGYGKTFSIRTCPRPFIINVVTEGGLLSLQDTDIPFVSISSLQELEDTIMELASPENWDKFDTLCIDSLSEIAEVCLAEYKKTNKDTRKSYVNMADDMMEQIRNLITIPGKNLSCICKQRKLQDEDGKILYSPDVPGNSFANKIPYYFDEVFALRILKDPETGEMRRYFQTYPDEKYDAKDRSGRLDMFEPADISFVLKKIRGES